MKRADIVIVAFDILDLEIMLDLERRVSEAFPNLRVEAEVQATVPIPKDSFNARRSQYLAPAFLDALEHLPVPALRVLGVTHLDLYAPYLHFIFGQARILGREGVIALARLKQEFYARPNDRQALLRRARVEAIHELGHTFGLEHCQNHHCVMFLSNGLADTDRKSDEYCTLCRGELAGLMRNNPSTGFAEGFGVQA